MKSYQSKHRDRKVIAFELDGRTFQFTAPKESATLIAMLGAVGSSDGQVQAQAARQMLNWFDDGLTEDDMNHIRARLEDNDDDLELADLVEITNDLLAEAMDRPTKPPSD